MIPTTNTIDFRSLITNDLKILSRDESISEKQVLILTRKFDPEATRVSIKLLAKGIDNVCLNVEDMPKSMRVRYHIDQTCNPRIEITIGDRNFEASRFPVVWLRDFDNTLMDIDIGGSNYSLARRFCYEQWNDSYHVLVDSLTSVWINSPEANLKATNRLAQLTVAIQLGFNIPETLLTNDPKAAAEFYQYNDGQVVMKAVHHHSIEMEGKVFSMYTRYLQKDDLSKLCDIIYAPCILQKRLYKKSELRITIVDKKIFAAELDTQAMPNRQDDLHRCDISKVPKKAVKLDSSVEKACLKFMAKFGLKYGAFDFILDKDDELYFLEVNPTGDWYWIEHDTNMPITDSMVSFIESIIKDSKS